MFEPKGQRVSLLSVVDQMCTWSPSIFCCSLQPHSSFMNALDQERLSKWMCFLSLSLFLSPSNLSSSPFPLSFTPSSPLPSPLFLSLFKKKKKNQVEMSSLKDDPSHSLISYENYSYVFFTSLSSFSNLLPPLPDFQLQEQIVNQ